MEKSINNIPEGSYSGYYWMSDATRPEVLSGGQDAESFKKIKVLKDLLANPESNPFVIEAQLYDSGNDRSLSVKYIDGKYYVKEYTGMKDDTKSNDKDLRIVHKRYYANRMDGKELHFLQYWRGEDDSLCAGEMKILQPAEMVFVGIQNVKDRKK